MKHFIFKKMFELCLNLSVFNFICNSVGTSGDGWRCVSGQLMLDYDTLIFKCFISSALQTMMFRFQQHRSMFLNLWHK